MILTALAAAQSHLHFADLHLNPVAIHIGFVSIKWYSIAYITGIVIGWWYLV